MSVAEDVRKALQEVVVPDLKAIDERIKGLDATTKLRDDALSAKMDNLSDNVDVRLEAYEAIAQARHGELLAKLETANVRWGRRCNPKVEEGSHRRAWRGRPRYFLLVGPTVIAATHLVPRCSQRTDGMLQPSTQVILIRLASPMQRSKAS